MATLASLYRRVPTLACQGKCAESCGPIIVAQAEHRAMVAAAGGQPFTIDDNLLTCGYLKAGRCVIYAHRPLLCRLWGVAKPMVCPWGCKPARMLSEQEGHVMLQALQRIGGKWITPATSPNGSTLVGPD